MSRTTSGTRFTLQFTARACRRGSTGTASPQKEASTRALFGRACRLSCVCIASLVRSPQFALRSALYLFLHKAIATPAVLLVGGGANKHLVFYSVRACLGATTGATSSQPQQLLPPQRRQSEPLAFNHTSLASRLLRLCACNCRASSSKSIPSLTPAPPSPQPRARLPSAPQPPAATAPASPPSSAPSSRALRASSPPPPPSSRAPSP